MNRRVPVYLALISILILICIACESTEDPVDPVEPPPGPAVAEGTVGAGGGTLTSDDGRLSIAIPPGALSADTNIRIAETATTDIDTLFDGFDAVQALSMEPAGLELSADASLTYAFPITVHNGAVLSSARSSAAGEEPREADNFVDVLVALAKERGDKVLIPDQTGDYNLDLRGFKLNLTNLNYLDEVVVGRPIKKDNPTEGSNYGTFSTGLRLPDDIFEDEWFEGDFYFWASDFHGFDNGEGGMVSIDPPSIPLEMEPGDLEPIESIITELDGFQRHHMKPKYRSSAPGNFGAGFNLRFDLQYDWDATDLPDALQNADIGEIKVTLRYKTFGFSVGECAKPPCSDPPPGGQIDIPIGTGLLDLAVGFTNPAKDPPPAGSGPWLFVTTDSTMSWHRLVQDNDGNITSTEKIGELPQIGGTCTFPVAQGSVSDRDICLFMHGPLLGGWRTHWNGTDWGIIVLEAGTVTDASRYLGTSDSNGWVWTNGSSVRFAEYDAQSGLFFETSGSISASQFPESNGGAHTAAVGDDIESVIVVMDGNPAEVWWHARVDVFDDADKLGVAGNDARQIRTANGIWAVSNNGTSNVTVGRWLPTPAITGTHAVGTKPVGIDVMGLQGGGAAVLTTSWENNTYTVLTVNADGSLAGTETLPMPGGCFAQYAIFVPGQVTYIALSCVQNQEVSLIPTTLQAAQ